MQEPECLQGKIIVYMLALVGELYVSGSNEYGQLGNGTNLDSDFSCVQLLEDIVEVAAGDYFSVALRADGTVWTWGVK